jgi:hypothetical protein
VTSGFAQADGNYRYITPGTQVAEFVVTINWTLMSSTVVGPIAIGAGNWIQGTGDGTMWNADVVANSPAPATIALCFSTSPSGPWTPFPYQLGNNGYDQDSIPYGGIINASRTGYISTSTSQVALSAGTGYYFGLCGGTDDTTSQATYVTNAKATFVVY